EPRGRMSEGTVHELPETLAEHEGPSIPLPRIVVPPVPLEAALVSGFELRVLSGFGFDHDDPREVRLLRVSDRSGPEARGERRRCEQQPNSCHADAFSKQARGTG